MARLKIPKDLFDDMTIIITKDGQLKLRKKPGVDSQTAKTAPAFRKSREMAKEFGRACKTADLMRRAFQSWNVKLDKKNLRGRLIKITLEAIRADTTNESGSHNFLQGKPEYLERFNFNTKKDVKGVDGATVYVDTENSTVTVEDISYHEAYMMAYSNRSLFCRVVSMCGSIDMDTGRVETDMQIGEVLDLDYEEIKKVKLINKIRLGKTYLNFLAIGLEFFYITNGVETPMAGGSNDPLTIIKVIRGE